jgi:YVTN family beta-propeller protein
MPHFALASGDRLLVSNFGGGDVTLLSRAKRQALATIAVGTGPLGQGATKDGKRVYVACHNANLVTVIDAESLRRIADIESDAGPVQVTVAPNQTSLMSLMTARARVQKIDLAGNKVVKTISIAPDGGSHGVGFAGDGRWLCPQRIRDLVATQKMLAVHEDGISLKCCYIRLG